MSILSAEKANFLTLVCLYKRPYCTFSFTDDSLSSTTKQGNSLATYSDIPDVKNDDSEYEEESSLYNYP